MVERSGHCWFRSAPAGEVQAQEQQIIDDGNLNLWMRLSDTNGDGIVDKTSFIVWNATTAYPNALLESSDNGTVFGPWWITGNGTSAANTCLLHDDAYGVADYKVVDGPNNQVQWLEPDNVTTVGNPFTGTAANLADPPPASVFNISWFTLTPLSPTLDLTIR